MIKNELTTTGTVKYYKMERRSVRSGYHGNNISGYQQSFLTETTICKVQQWGKVWTIVLFLIAIMREKAYM